jgi:serine phosphatase RsbU (regulator of sigma subunit)
VRALGHDGRDPAEVLTILDEVLADWHNGARKPTAVAYCVVARRGADLEVSLCLAGHPPALLRGVDGHVREAGVLGGMLGCGLPLSLTTAHYTLTPGDTLLLATDGVSEARAHEGRGMFGEDSLVALLAAQPSTSGAADLVEAVIDAVSAYSGGVFSDDVAVLAIANPEPTPQP